MSDWIDLDLLVPADDYARLADEALRLKAAPRKDKRRLLQDRVLFSVCLLRPTARFWLPKLRMGSWAR